MIYHAETLLLTLFAKDPDTGEIVDYFNGMKDIWGSIIRTPLDPVKTF